MPAPPARAFPRLARGAARTGGSGAVAPTRRPRPGPRPGPASRAPARGAPAEGGSSGPAATEGRRPARAQRSRGSAPAFALCPAPRLLPVPPGGQAPGLPRLSLVPSSALRVSRPRWPGPGLPPQAKAADALSQPGPPRYFSDAVTVFIKQREKKHAPRGNARPQSKRNCLRARAPPQASSARGQAAGRLEGHPASSARRPPSRARDPWRFDSAGCYLSPFPKSRKGLSCGGRGIYCRVRIDVGWGQSPG